MGELAGWLPERSFVGSESRAPWRAALKPAKLLESL